MLSSRSDFSEVAPYFIEYVRQQLDTRFGPDLYTNGLRIYTTIDLDMQQAAERALTQQLDAIEGGTYGEYEHPTYSQYIEKREDQSESPVPTPYLQGLAVTLEAKTGAIRAMVGGRDFNDSKFNRATQAHTAAGSTFKPLRLRGGAPGWLPVVHHHGGRSASALRCVPANRRGAGRTTTTSSKAPMTLREALYKSRNIIAIKLGMEIGPQAVIGEAAALRPHHQHPALSFDLHRLGGRDSARDHLRLQRLRQPRAPAPRRTRSNGWKTGQATPCGQPQPRSDVVMDSALAWLMVDAMRDVVRRGTAASTVGARFTIAAGGKTGTTNDYTDVWFIGFTPDLVTGLWIGMDKPQKIMGNAQGGRLAAPAWTAMMREIYERRPTPAAWSRPGGLTFVEIDRGTGYKFTPFCPKDSLYVESFIPGTEPKEFCPIHSPFGNSQSNPLQNRP